MFVLNLSLIYALLCVLGLICLNVLLGVAVSFKNGTFSLEKLPKFLQSEVLPYGLSLSGLVAAAQIDFTSLAASVSTIASNTLPVIAWTAIAAYVAKMLEEIFAKIMTLFGVEVDK